MKKILALTVLIMWASFTKAQTDTIKGNNWALDDSSITALGLNEKFNSVISIVQYAQKNLLGSSDSILMVGVLPHPSEFSLKEAWTKPLGQKNGINYYVIYTTIKLLAEENDSMLETVLLHEFVHIALLYNLENRTMDKDMAEHYEIMVIQIMKNYLGEKRVSEYLQKYFCHVFGPHNAREAENRLQAIENVIYAPHNFLPDTLGK